jgi:acyl-CoA dehydrogenase
MSRLSQDIFAAAARDEPEVSSEVQLMLEHMPAWAAAADADGITPEAIWSLVPARTLNRMNIPPALGGVAMTATATRRAVVFENVGRICAALPMSLPGPGLSMPPVMSLGTPEQKERYFAGFTQCDTPKWGAFAITEPRGGSDATGLRTAAVADGDNYVINGEKCFITNGDRADHVVVFATIAPEKGRFGIRAFVVDRSNPGFAVERCEDMLGLRAARLAALRFTDCRVHKTAMLGHTGKRGPFVDAFQGAQSAWDYMRPALAASINGASMGAIEYAETRLATGAAPLARARRAEGQVALAALRGRVHASQLIALKAAWMYDRGDRASNAASAAKAYASSLAMQVADRLSALLPGEILTGGSKLEKFCRDAKGFDILEGTGDMQRLMIARGRDTAVRR